MITPDWKQLLADALTLPGRLSTAYSMFHNYSFSNRLWAMAQLEARGLPISPIASYNGWKKLGRQVKKGEKALSLLMPRMYRIKDESGESAGSQDIRMGFMVRNHWFSLDQTEGEAYAPDLLIPDWNCAVALDALNLREEVFSDVNGNKMGYSVPCEGMIAVNPLNPLPWKTRFHEMAHCLLHTEAAMLSDNQVLDDSLIEIEAESVAYLCCASLGLPGLAESRGYIQHWMQGSESKRLTGKTILRIFGAADRILSAGKPAQPEAGICDQEYIPHTVQATQTTDLP